MDLRWTDPTKGTDPKRKEPINGDARYSRGSHLAGSAHENPDMESPCTLRLTIIKGHLQGRPSQKIRKFDGEFSP